MPTQKNVKKSNWLCFGSTVFVTSVDLENSYSGIEEILGV